MLAKGKQFLHLIRKVRNSLNHSFLYLLKQFYLSTNKYVPQTKFGRHIVFAPFLLIIIIIIILILIIILLLLSFFHQKFIRHISWRLQNGNQWNFTGMLSTMSRCADYFRNFQNGRHCHRNGQNAKKLKNSKMIIAGYSPNRNWWNLIGTHPHLVEREKPKKSEPVGQTLPQLPWKQKRMD